MSDITITKDNLSRFTKRLQKALKKQFNQEVPLHVASTLFANALGSQGEYELKQQLDIPIPKNQNNHIDKNTDNKDNVQDIYTIKAQQLLDDFSTYFASGKSLLSSLVILYIDRNASIQLTSYSKKFPQEEEGFGLYFEDNPIQYLHKNLDKILHSHDDLLFLESICTKYFNHDFLQNIYLGSRLIRLLGIDSNQRGGQVSTVSIYQKK